MGERRGWWGRTVHKWAAAERELEAEDLRRAAEAAGGVPMGACRDREDTCVAGTVRAVTVRTGAGVPSLEADIYDGSGTVTLVFLGRKYIPGIEAGRSLKASGRVTVQDRRTTIFNPRYELLVPGSREPQT